MFLDVSADESLKHVHTAIDSPHSRSTCIIIILADLAEMPNDQISHEKEITFVLTADSTKPLNPELY